MSIERADGTEDLHDVDFSQFLHEVLVQTGADAISATFGKASLIVTRSGAKLVSPETGPVDVPISPCDRSIEQERRSVSEEDR